MFSSVTDAEILEAASRVNGLAGMTVNERLFLSGLMEEFDKAKHLDKNKARKILEVLQVDNPSIDRIIQ